MARRRKELWSHYFAGSWICRSWNYSDTVEICCRCHGFCLSCFWFWRNTWVLPLSHQTSTMLICVCVCVLPLQQCLFSEQENTWVWKYNGSEMDVGPNRRANRTAVTIANWLFGNAASAVCVCRFAWELLGNVCFVRILGGSDFSRVFLRKFVVNLQRDFSSDRMCLQCLSVRTLLTRIKTKMIWSIGLNRHSAQVQRTVQIVFNVCPWLLDCNKYF